MATWQCKADSWPRNEELLARLVIVLPLRATWKFKAGSWPGNEGLLASDSTATMGHVCTADEEHLKLVYLSLV